MENKLQTVNKEQSLQQKNIADNVMTRIKDMEANGEIQTPKSYSYQNALKSAWLMLQEVQTKDKQPVLQACTKTSICNALLDMCVQGLSVAKKQAYFIPYGKQLTLSKSYLGNIACTKRLKGVKDVKAFVIYEGDEFEQTFDLVTATLKVTKYVPKFENIDLKKIIGAFAVVVMEEGDNFVEVMTMNQIKNAWNQGTAYKSGKSTAHNNFTDEMAKKTVINRACKHFVCTSDDSDVLVESIMRTNEYKPEDIVEEAHEEVQEEIKENANQEIIDVDLDNGVSKEAEAKEETTEQTQFGGGF